MNERRGFLAGMLALAAAPAIVRADSLMRVVSRDTAVITLPASRMTATDVINLNQQMAEDIASYLDNTSIWLVVWGEHTLETLGPLVKGRPTLTEWRKSRG